MIELVPHGVYIPPELRESLIENKLVFFCGAGVSAQAGLPSFKDLIKKVIESASIRDKYIQDLVDKGSYDQVLDAIERDKNLMPSAKLRGLIKELLSNGENNRQFTIDPHKILLKLSHSEFGEGRLITTNFDDLFTKAYKKQFHEITPKIDVFPRLPFPDLNWNTIVHLHGSLFQDKDGNSANIILTSADFGKAYLLDHGIGKFIVDLFKNFKVVFIGYSLEDPVVKYLFHALAVERKIANDQILEHYAFVSYQKDSDLKAINQQWLGWGIQPLLYKIKNKKDGNQHSYLWSSLKSWADLHESGLEGRRSIALKHANEPPPATKDNDYEIRNMCWALGKRDGSIARAWAEYKTFANIAWLEKLDENGLLKNLTLDRPRNDAELTSVTKNFIPWLIRYLDNSILLNWVFRKSGILHEDFSDQIKIFLKKEESKKFNPSVKKIWIILISEIYRSRLFSWFKSFDLNYEYLDKIDNYFSLHVFIDAFRPVVIFKTLENSVRKDLIKTWHQLEGSKIEVENPIQEKPRDYANIDIRLCGQNYLGSFHSIIQKLPEKIELLTSLAHHLSNIICEIEELFKFLEMNNYIENASSFYRRYYRWPNSISVDSWEIILGLMKYIFDKIKELDRTQTVSLLQIWKSYQGECWPYFIDFILNKEKAKFHIENLGEAAFARKYSHSKAFFINMTLKGFKSFLETEPNIALYAEAWEDYCDAFPLEALKKLSTSSKEQCWPIILWSKFLFSVRKNSDLGKSFEKNILLLTMQNLKKFPKHILGSLQISIEAARFIQLNFTKQKLPTKTYWEIWDELWLLSKKIEDDITLQNVVDLSLNRVPGILAEQLIKILFLQKENPDGEIPKEIESRLNFIILDEAYQALLGKVTLSSDVLYFFRVFRDWTVGSLLPLLSQKKNPNEWLHNWRGFLRSSGIYPTLFIILRKDFFELISRHLEDFDENIARKALQIFTYISLPPNRSISLGKTKSIISDLNPKFLTSIIYVLISTLRSAEKKNAAKIWEKYIKHWLKDVWPRTNAVQTSHITAAFLELSLQTNEKFEDCFKNIHDFLSSEVLEEDLLVFIKDLSKSEYPAKYPNTILEILSLLIHQRPRYLYKEIKQIFDVLPDKYSNAVQNEKYKKLKEILRG